MPGRVAESYRFHTFKVDADERLVFNGDQPVALTPKAFQTLLVLLQNQGKLVTKEELLQQVWPDSFVEETSLTQNIWMLRRALGQQPDGPTFIETVPKYGYRFVADVTVPPSLSDAAPTPPAIAAPATDRSTLVWVIPAVLLIAGVLAYFGLRPGGIARLATRPAVAVIEFKNLSGDHDAAWLSTALSEMFSTELGAGSRLRMISNDSVARLQASAPSIDEKETLARIHNSLQGDLLVTGSFLRVAGKIRVDVRLLDAASGETLDSVSQTDDEANLLNLVSAAGSRLRAKLRIAQPSSGQEQSVRAAAAGNQEAIRLYSEGLALLRRYDATSAEPLLTRAIQADPRFPMAHSALSAAWSLLGYDEKAKSEAKLAFDLSGRLSHEDGLLVEGRYRQAGSEWTKAIAVYQTLWGFFPDDIEYGLQLVAAQTRGGQGKQALDTIRSLRALKSSAADARVDIAEARTGIALSDFHRGLDSARRAIALAQSQGARALEASARLDEGSCLQRLTEPDQARASFQAARDLCNAIGDQACVAEAMSDIGVLSRTSGDLDQATQMFKDALSIERRIGDRRGIAKSLGNLANVLRSRADMEGAKALYEEALAVGRETGDQRGVTLSLISIGNVLNNTGHPEPAKDRYREAQQIARETGDRSQVAISMGNLAILAYTEGDLAGARKSLEEVLELKRQIADRSSVAYTLGHLGTVYLAQGDIVGARKAWKEQCQIHSTAGHKIDLANCELGLAELDMLDGHPDAVEAPARRIATEFKTVNPAADAWNVLAEASLLRGDLKQANQDSANAVSLADKSPNVADYKLPIAIVAARVAGASGHAPQALRSLNDSLTQARKLNLARQQFQARYAICEIRRDRAETTQLIAEADKMGFGLVAQRARLLLR